MFIFHPYKIVTTKIVPINLRYVNREVYIFIRMFTLSIFMVTIRVITIMM